MVGKVKICLGLGEHVLSNRWHRPFQPLLCLPSSFLKVFVSNLTRQLVDFGGILNLSPVHTGLQCLGLLFVGPKRREAWVSGISGTSTKLSSPNLAGGF